MRIMTHAQLTNTWSPSFQPDSGFRTFYYYDGSDVALTVIRGPANNYWVGQRYLTGGIDAQLAGRFSSTSGGAKSLVLVAGQDGTSIVNVKADGVEDLNSPVITRGPFGTLEGGGSPPSTNAQTGFAGGSTPNQTGGFVYLRNRWYDPKTGRFLTQDPIGLAGGVNLYAYAGSNPITFSDPFGLCPYAPPRSPDTSDCPKDKIGDAFRLLGTSVGGKEGAETIDAIYQHNIGVFAMDSQTSTNNYSISVDTLRPVDGVAAKLVHEGTHIIELHKPNPLPYSKQEPMAWERALTVWGRSARQDQSYKYPYQRWRENPRRFRRAVERCSADHPGQPCQY
jgi:RHS repeat-associated protein